MCVSGNHCAWEVETSAVPHGHLGVKLYSGQTTNIVSHLASHGLTQEKHDKIQRGEVDDVSVEVFQQRWSEQGQKRAAQVMATWVAKDRLPPNIVTGEGFKVMMHQLLGGRVRVPHPTTIVRHSEDLKMDHDKRLLRTLQDLSRINYPITYVEADIWEAPNKQHWIAFIMHYVTEDFFMKSLVLYTGKIASKTALSQAQRLISAVKRFGGIDVSDLVWVISSDSGSNNVLVSFRC